MTYFISFLALGIGSFGIFCNVIFYSSLGIGVYAITYGIIGFLLDILKYACVKMFNKALSQNGAIETYSAFAFWFILSVISFIAGYGFISTALNQFEQTQMMQSNVYNSSLLSVNNARVKVESLANFADSSSADKAKNEKAKLEKELTAYLQSPAKNGQGHIWGTIAGRTGDCSSEYSYYVKSYCPKIKKLEADIDTQNKLIAGHLQYISASAYLEKTSIALSDITSTGGSIHSVFKNIGNLLSVEPAFVRDMLTMITSIIMEIASSWLIFMKTRLYQSPTQFEDVQRINHSNPAYKRLSHDSVKNQSVGLSMSRLPLIGKLSVGKGDQRLKHARKALVNGLIKPSKYGLQKWSKQNGGMLSDSAIADFQREWLKEDLIEECTAANGKCSYKLVE